MTGYDFHFMYYIKHIKMDYYAGCSNNEKPRLLRASLDGSMDSDTDRQTDSFLKPVCSWLSKGFSLVHVQGEIRWR